MDHFLKAKLVKTVSVMGLFSLSLSVFAQGSINSQQIADDLYLLKGAGNNVLVLEGNDSLSLVDGGDATNAKALQSFLNDQYNNKPVSTLFNTHWHLHQTGSNEDLKQAGAEIIAHQYTKLWMGTEVISKWENKVYSPRSSDALPTVTFFYDSESISLDGVNVEYGYLPQAHTDGDIYVYFSEQNVVAGGGVVSGGDYPLFDYSSNGWIGGMINSLQLLLEKTNEDTIFVPAQGELRSRADIEEQLALCSSLIQALTQSYYAGETYEDLLASEPLKDFEGVWSGDAALFLQTAYDGAWGHVTELRRFR